jgi:RND family efflux transporter MFP subunit
MPTTSQRSFWIFYLLGFVLIAAVAGGVWYFWQARQQREAQETKARAEAAAAGPSVQVATAVRGAGVRRVALVGEALPYKSTTLYSKVSGYLTRIAVDVGDRVKAGQFIAEIQSPEIDQQITTLRATVENKRRLLSRTHDLAQRGFFSKQALDNAQTDVAVAESQLAELRTVSGFRTLHAPFGGVITARFADPGALVTNASSNQSAALPLVTISDTSRLKVAVYAEQSEAPNVKPGLEAEIVDAANPQRTLKGTVARISGELDPRTRTLLTEVDVDNSAGQMVAGSFVNVNLLIPAPSFVEVPAPALVSRDKKSMVALVTADKTIRLQPIEVAGTDGKVLRVASGLNEGERVALNVPPSLNDGSHITPVPAPGAPPPAPTQTAPPPTAPPAATPPARPKPQAKAAPIPARERALAPAPAPAMREDSVQAPPAPPPAPEPAAPPPSPRAPTSPSTPSGPRKPAPGEV